jgi:hypothetical protein
LSKRVVLAAGAAALALFGIGVPAAAAGHPDSPSAEVSTLAIYGDAPYGIKPSDTAEFNATPAFINTVNADPSVSGVIHVGDNH